MKLTILSLLLAANFSYAAGTLAKLSFDHNDKIADVTLSKNGDFEVAIHKIDEEREDFRGTIEQIKGGNLLEARRSRVLPSAPLSMARHYSFTQAAPTSILCGYDGTSLTTLDCHQRMDP